MPIEKQQSIEKSINEAFNEEALQQRLPREEFEKYLAAKKNINFHKGNTIFDDGEQPKGVYYVLSGTVKLSKSGSYGKDQILRFIKEGDIIGYRSLLCGENLRARAEAMTETETSFIPSEIFMHLLEIDPKMCFAMLQKIAYELGESANTVTFLAQKTVRERLAEVLLLLEQKLGNDPEGYIKISLTREEIANLIGTATESAIRLISEFKSDKLIEAEGRNIKILNHEKLRKLGHIL